MEIKYLEVLVMDNNEILCNGNTVGWVNKLGRYLHSPYQSDVLKQKEMLEAVKELRDIAIRYASSHSKKNHDRLDIAVRRLNAILNKL